MENDSYNIDGDVICGSNSYEKKYYFNNKFDLLPDAIKKELQIMSVLFTEDVGGIFIMYYDKEGKVKFEVMSTEFDPFFDEIGSELKIREMRKEKRELLEAMELFYKTFSGVKF